MRLIYADELKEKLFIKFGNQLPNGLFEEIDNLSVALFPLTVTLNDKVTDEDIELLKRLMKDYKPQVLNLEEERPQGEWISIHTDFAKYHFKCSICGREINTHGQPLTDYPFCHCGADMRGDNDDG